MLRLAGPFKLYSSISIANPKIKFNILNKYYSIIFTVYLRSVLYIAGVVDFMFLCVAGILFQLAVGQKKTCWAKCI